MGSQLAWWMLSQKNKDTLQQMRGRGMFGGMPGKAPYMWVQEGSTAGGAAGAAGAGITPTHFIKNALESLDIDGIIDDLLMR